MSDIYTVLAVGLLAWTVTRAVFMLRKAPDHISRFVTSFLVFGSATGLILILSVSVPRRMDELAIGGAATLGLVLAVVLVASAFLAVRLSRRSNKQR